MDTNKYIALKEELNAIKKAIDNQLKLKGQIPNDSFELVLNTLEIKRESLENNLLKLGNVNDKDELTKIEGEFRVKESQVGIAGDHAVISGDLNRIFVNQNKTNANELKISYLNRILNNTGILHLSGIDPKIATCENETEIHLSSIYTDLMINSQTDYNKDQRMMKNVSNYESAINIINNNKYLAILGDPGSGKTTFINFVAWCFAGELLNKTEANLNILTRPLPDENDGKDINEKQVWSHGALIPIIITLRDFAATLSSTMKASSFTLWQYIIDDLVKSGINGFEVYLQKELIEKGGLIFLDGLDEIPESENKRELIKQLIEDFIKTYHKCRIIITTRTYAYQNQNWRISGLKEVLIAPFTDGQIIRFIDKWYKHLAIVKSMRLDNAMGLSELLKKAIFKNQRLRELASRPLLLTLMTSLHSWRGGSLPEKREDLYADSVDLLLDWWERPKTVRNLNGSYAIVQPSLAEWLKTDRTKVFKILCELAFNGHKNQTDLHGTADINEKDLVYSLLALSNNTDIRPRRLIEYLSNRAGLILQRGVDIYTFPHRTFQEYLSACFLTDNDYPERVAELFKNDPMRWHEVALLSGAKASRGSISAAWILAEELCYIEPIENEVTEKNILGAILAGELVTESIDINNLSKRNETKLNRIISWLVKIISLKNTSPLQRTNCGKLLSMIGEPRKEVLTIENSEMCFIPQDTFLMGSVKENNLFNDREYPQHTLELPPYFISKYPITNSQFKQFAEDNAYEDVDFWIEAKNANVWQYGKIKGYFDKEARNYPQNYGSPFNLSNHPVVGVTFYEALAYTRWLTEKLHKEQMIPDNWIVSLPSEAEWEKAARGGLNVPLSPIIISLKNLNEFFNNPFNNENIVKNPEPSRLFPWGNNQDENNANVKNTRINTTSSVGCFNSGMSPFGVEEMIGNVWEWTRSLNFDYPYDINDGRENLHSLKTTNEIIARGGSFYWDQTKIYCSYREWVDPNYSFNDMGFRIIIKKINS
ncbi:Serine/threonine-protein kinase pkn1 [Candidatus Magnetomorum sp. HK-1]|nr:Serine/threonine-protein kinase pkn1 [Candidatus Magnetomorum sp. HK-1]